MIGFFYHDLFARHLEDYGHVEGPQRLESILKRVKKSPISDSISFLEAEPAEMKWLERVHDRGYIEGIMSLDIKEAVILDWGDTVATAASPQAALFAAGAGVKAVRMVLAGELTSAFCAVRPPGHHAERSRAMGFCIFNNIAVAAAYLLEEGKLERVAIVDWDVHHGNATENMFIDSDRVFYISLHQYPHYPGTGHPDNVGAGRGTGFTLNIPMAVGEGDKEYIEAIRRRVLPVLDDFKPQFILISAGFDAHGSDPLSGTLLTSPAYGEMTTLIREVAERHSSGRVVSFLEGGYDVVSLAESVEEHLAALI